MSSGIPMGHFVWYELLTSDIKQAEDFYTKLIGWGAMKWEKGDYWMWMNGEAPVGGFMQLPEEAKSAGAPPHWLPYISTPDLESTVAKIQSLGGTILNQVSIPEIGAFAIVQDPQHAVFAAYMPETSQSSASEEPGAREFSWHELATTDSAAAFEFYSGVFGWNKTEAMDMGPGGIYQMYGYEGRTVGGMYRMPAEMPAPPHWLVYIMVDNIDAAVQKVKALGGQVLNGPMEVPGGDQIAQCMDPQGAAFAIHAKKKG